MTYLTVVLPVRNEARFIEQTLEMIVRQDYPADRFELIVVDGMSTDGTRDAVERFMRTHVGFHIRLLENPGLLSSRARNIGVRAAQGKLIAVIDGHVQIPHEGLFASMEAAREQRQALCLARPAPLDIPGLREGRAFWIALARKTWLGHSRNSYIYSDYEGFVDPMSSGFAYDRSLFDRVGYFDESFDAAEDVEFHYRLKEAGFSAYTSPDFLIYSFPRPSFRDLFRQQVRYGEGRARLVRKHPGAFSLETPVPALILLLFLLAPLVLVTPGCPTQLRLVWLVAIVLYCVLLLSASVFEVARIHRFAPSLEVAVAIATTHLGLGWGFLKRLWRPVKSQVRPQSTRVPELP